MIIDSVAFKSLALALKKKKFKIKIKNDGSVKLAYTEVPTV